MKNSNKFIFTLLTLACADSLQAEIKTDNWSSAENQAIRNNVKGSGKSASEQQKMAEIAGSGTATPKGEATSNSSQNTSISSTPGFIPTSKEHVDRRKIEIEQAVLAKDSGKSVADKKEMAERAEAEFEGREFIPSKKLESNADLENNTLASKKNNNTHLSEQKTDKDKDVDEQKVSPDEGGTEYSELTEKEKQEDKDAVADCATEILASSSYLPAPKITDGTLDRHPTHKGIDVPLNPDFKNNKPGDEIFIKNPTTAKNIKSFVENQHNLSKAMSAAVEGVDFDKSGGLEAARQFDPHQSLSDVCGELGNIKAETADVSASFEDDYPTKDIEVFAPRVSCNRLEFKFDFIRFMTSQVVTLLTSYIDEYINLGSPEMISEFMINSFLNSAFGVSCLISPSKTLAASGFLKTEMASSAQSCLDAYKDITTKVGVGAGVGLATIIPYPGVFGAGFEMNMDITASAKTAACMAKALLDTNFAKCVSDRVTQFYEFMNTEVSKPPSLEIVMSDMNAYQCKLSKNANSKVNALTQKALSATCKFANRKLGWLTSTTDSDCDGTTPSPDNEKPGSQPIFISETEFAFITHFKSPNLLCQTHDTKVILGQAVALELQRWLLNIHDKTKVWDTGTKTYVDLNVQIESYFTSEFSTDSDITQTRHADLVELAKSKLVLPPQNSFLNLVDISEAPFQQRIIIAKEVCGIFNNYTVPSEGMNEMFKNWYEAIYNSRQKENYNSKYASFSPKKGDRVRIVSFDNSNGTLTYPLLEHPNKYTTNEGFNILHYIKKQFCAIDLPNLQNSLSKTAEMERKTVNALETINKANELQEIARKHAVNAEVITDDLEDNKNQLRTTIASQNTESFVDDNVEIYLDAWGAAKQAIQKDKETINFFSGF